MDVLPLIIFAVPIGLFFSSFMWTQLSSSTIAQEHRQHVNEVRERVLRERMQLQQQRAAHSSSAAGGPFPALSSAASSSSASFPAPSAPPLPSFIPYPDAASSPSPRPAPTAPPAPPRPSDLQCPICLDSTSFAVETNCSHTYCAACILDYFERGGSSVIPQAVVCPCCRRRVDALLTRFTAAEEGSAEFAPILHRVQAYNLRYSSHPRSFRDSFADTPTYLRRFVTEMSTSPWGAASVLLRTHFLLTLLGSVAYVVSPFDFLPEAMFGLLGFVDDALVIVVVCVFLASLYRAMTMQRMAQRT